VPVHDWRRVRDGTFHDFHYSWVLEIKRALMRGRTASFGGSPTAAWTDTGVLPVSGSPDRRRLTQRRDQGRSAEKNKRA
jgi:hypothetical protein